MTPLGTLEPLSARHITVMNADVVAYSAMMERDAPTTILALIQNVRWISNAVERAGGILIDAVGDNLMARFPTETDALQCASLIQQSEALRNCGLPDHAHIRLRIGVHSGIAFEYRGRLYGEALNVASRLQNSAPAGGLAISSPVANHASQLLRSARYSEAVLELKNITVPVTALMVSIR